MQRVALIVSLGVGLFVATLLDTDGSELDRTSGYDHAVVLLYHHVADDTPASTSVRIADFERHLETIESLGIEVRELGAVIDTFERGESLAEPTVVFTFDDAWQSIVEHAAPRLSRRGWPFTIFVSTDPVDRGFQSYASWDALRQAVSEGASIQNHSRDHGHLLEGREANDWAERLRENIGYANQRITDEIGVTPRFFAWPFGEFDAGLLRELGAMDLIGFGQQSGVLDAGWVTAEALPPYVRSALPRFPISTFQAADGAFRLRLQAAPLPAAPSAFEFFVDTDASQELRLRFEDAALAREVGCFDASGNPLTIIREDSTVRVSSNVAIPVGRSKYTCTARNRARAGSWYWYSHPWFRPAANGTFPD